MSRSREGWMVGQAPRDLQPTASPLNFFGAELRRLRQQAGLSQAGLGRLLFHHKDLIRKIESAERTPTKLFVEQCDEALNADGTLRRMWPMLERERRLRRSRNHTSLVRTPVFRAEASDRPVLDWLLASTDGAHRRRADGEITSPAAQQLRHLREVDHARGAGETYPEVAARLGCRFDDLIRDAPGIATGYLELAGYEAVDLGTDGLAQQHYLQALSIVTRSGDRLYGGYLIAVSLAHLALHCGDTDQAILLTTAALRGTEHQASPAVRAAFRAVLARAHARRGDETACAAALLQVDADLARSNPADEPGWISYFGEADLADERAHCFFDLGLHSLAQREASRAIDLLAPTRVRRLAIDTALHASALARADEIEQACAVGHRAVDYAAATDSFRTAHRIGLMMAELHPYADLPVVEDLTEYSREMLKH